MSKAKLTTKIINGAISALNKSVPEGAVTYDLVKGISKKGNFSIYSYKDATGRIIGRESQYLKNGEKLTEFRHYEYLSNARYTHTRSYLNDDLPDISQSLMVFDPAKASKHAWKFDINECGVFDVHKISYLSPGKKPQGLKFDTFYDGDIPFCIRSFNTGNRTLAKRNREYLPLVTTEILPNVEQKVKHISALQEKKLHLEGVLPPIKRVPHGSLQGSDDLETLGRCQFKIGQINYSDELTHNRNLLSTLSHEYKHASDASKCYRLQSNIDDFGAMPEAQKTEMIEADKRFEELFNFAEKSMQKGAIQNNSKGGQRFAKIEESFENDAIPYWDRLVERRARQASAEQLQRYDSCWNSLGKLFQAEFIPKLLNNLFY